jgi:hypothetical protein
MVKVTGYVIRKRKDGTNFVSLEISGGLELVQSQTTGKFYATLRKCTIPSTFDENIARMMVGSEMPGDVVRTQSDPYEYVNPRTGEVMLLHHTYAYRPVGSMELIGHSQVRDLHGTPL